MAIDSFKVKKSLNVQPSAAPVLTEQGDVGFNSATDKLQVRDASGAKSVVTEDGTATLTGKTLDASTNTISGLTLSNLAAGVVDTDLAAVAGTDTTVASAKAIKTYVDAAVAAVQAEVDAEESARAAADTAILAQKAAPNGIATLDSSGKLSASQVAAIAITDTYVVASESAMLSLSLAETGDIAVRSDQNKSYILKGTSYSTLADWQELLTPTDSVQSVNGQTGAVTLTKSDVGLGSVDNTSDATKNTATATLTNKTISGASNTLTNIARSSIATGTAHGVVINDGSGALSSVAPGASGNVLTSNGTNWVAQTAAAAAARKFAFISDIKAGGADGGAAVAGQQTRTLNTLVDTNSIVTSLASNQFTLPAGSYYITASAPAFQVIRHKIKLRNITDTTDPLTGTSEYSGAGVAAQTRSFLEGIVTIAAPKVFSILHHTQQALAGSGLGTATSDGTPEIYTVVQIEKLS